MASVAPNLDHSNEEPIYFCYLYRDRSQDIAHLIADRYLTSGNIETAYRFVCGDDYIGYHRTREYDVTRLSQEELNNSEIPICPNCLGPELYIANPRHISTATIWIPNVGPLFPNSSRVRSKNLSRSSRRIV